MAELNAPPQAPTGNPGLDLLLARRSDHELAEPGPADDELELIFRAALRVPDFRQLRPYRFLAARGDGLARLGAAMQRAALVSAQPPAVVERAARLPRRAPLVVVAIASPRPDRIVSEFDQILSAGCTVHAMQLAARSLGYGGVWRSGWLMDNAAFARELGLAAGERIVGFLYLGTPPQPAPPPPVADPTPLVQWL